MKSPSYYWCGQLDNRKASGRALVRQRVGVAVSWTRPDVRQKCAHDCDGSIFFPATCYHPYPPLALSIYVFVSLQHKDKQHYSQYCPAGSAMHNEDWCSRAKRSLGRWRTVVAFIRPVAKQSSGSWLLTSGCSSYVWTGHEANQGEAIVIFTNGILPQSYIIVSPKASVCLLA